MSRQEHNELFSTEDEANACIEWYEEQGDAFDEPEIEERNGKFVVTAMY